MPELPEVETIRRDLRALLVGQKFIAVRVDWPGSVVVPEAKSFARQVAGQSILDISRRGKYLVFALSGGHHLLIHLKMSGRLLVEPSSAPADRHTRLVFELDDGQELRFVDSRKFGRVYLVQDPMVVLGGLGPEPLGEGFTLAALGQLLARRRGRLKSLLLNQEFLAGLGNIYTDEVLFRARIHPLRPASSLAAEEVEKLYGAIREVLGEAITHRGTTLSDASYKDVSGQAGRHQQELAVYQRTGQPCLRCGGPIERLVVAGRGTHICPRCQSV